MGLLDLILGDYNSRAVKRYTDIVAQINALESKYKDLDDSALREVTQTLREKLKTGIVLEELLPEAFAAVREAASRTLKQRHYDVQLMGGMALHEGKISEMRTGEGKTLVATLPAYLNALTSQGVHVVTVNDYLSRRDAVWMGQVYAALGLTTGCLNHEASYVYDASHKPEAEGGEVDTQRDQTGSFKVFHEYLRPVSRREAYLADITYGTNNEFGFDYLRDNMVYALEQRAQARGHSYAIVDEIDSILIDEARTPLIISAPDTDSTKLYETFARVVPRLVVETDYTIDEKLRSVSITEAGIEKVEKALNLQNIYEDGGTRYVHHLEQALRAQVMFQRDKDYVVKDNEVIIVDEFTGRLMPGRRWSDGLHQAVEAKESVLVQKESRTLASITFQNYFRLYKKLSGMTGTAQTSAEEFHKVYKLDVITIPTNRPMQRVDLPDRIYKNETGKFKAIVAEVKTRHAQGQPILIGTVSIAKNELLSAMLNREGIAHRVLNAKNHEQEGEIIAQAGRAGMVTVATNMAGRGVDIILGGNPPLAADAERVRAAGGLHVIGTERHEARRIDNQLRGRAGRQGDPGSSQFFVSTEDEVIRIFGGDRLRSIMERLGVSEDEAIENSFVSRAIEQAQSKIEGHNFDTRKYVLEYDDVANKHRVAVYGLRNAILEGTREGSIVLEYLYSTVEDIIRAHMPEGQLPETEPMFTALTAILPTNSLVKEDFIRNAEQGSAQSVIEYVHEILDSAYRARADEVGAEGLKQLEKAILLRVIDELWVAHLEELEHLRESVRLRAYGQRDPLVEYKIEGQRLFNDLMTVIRQQVAQMFFKISVIKPQTQTLNLQEKRDTGAVPQTEVQKMMPDQQTQRQTTVPLHSDKIGRNDPCPCGSGLKYKKCGLINAPQHKQ